MVTTIGQILVNNALPPALRDYGRVLGKSEADDVLARVAKDYPERYEEVSKALNDLGRHAAFEEGTTLRLSDIQPQVDKADVLAHVKEQERRIRNDKTLSPEDKQEALEGVYGYANEALKKMTYDAALSRENPFALQVKSKARGNPDQLAGLLTSPGVYQDGKDRIVPVFIGHSYSEGLAPHEYWAATYGARKGVVSTKFATRQAGYLGKLLGSSAMDAVVTSRDCETPYGIPVDAADDQSIGAVLARDTAGFPAGTIVDPKVLTAIRKKKVDEFVVRSPITCGNADGLCSKCVGVRESGSLPPVGYHIGANASSALANEIAQNSLNLKHCLFSETLVMRPDFTSTRICDLKVGDHVMGCDLAGHMRPVRVLNVFDNGNREVYRTYFKPVAVRTADEVYVDATLDHKIRAMRRVSSQLDEQYNGIPRVIPIGTASKHFYAIPPTSFDDSGLRSEPYALLVGLLLGDGCYTKSVVGIHFSCADLTLIDALRTYLAAHNLKLSKLGGHAYYYRLSQLSEDSADRLGHPIKNYLIQRGMYGKYSYEKTLPPDVDTWDNASVAQLIGGLLTTDGSIYHAKGKPGIAFCSTSRVMVEQLSRLLGLRWGITTSAITTTTRAGTGGGSRGCFARRDQYQFTITAWEDVRRMSEIIPLYGARRVRLQALIDGYTPGRTTYRGYKRTRVEYRGSLPTYDIEVDHPDHLFVLANRIVVSNSGKKQGGTATYAGFDVIKNLATVPKNYPDHATVAEEDGVVESIDKAPQGGHYVTIGGRKHYVTEGMPVLVKPGERVEAGDQLSDGVVNPADVVRLKGVGDGARYFANRFTQAFRESKHGVHRRNVEVLARSMVNHVQINDPEATGGHLPGDVVRYSNWARNYKPRKDAARLAPRKAIGAYLEEPALHYSVGTRVTQQVADKLAKHGTVDVLAHKNPVGVDPVMLSVVKVPEHSGDWMARLGTSYLQQRLLEDVQRGATSDIHGTHPIPGIAKGVELGANGHIY